MHVGYCRELGASEGRLRKCSGRGCCYPSARVHENCNRLALNPKPAENKQDVYRRVSKLGLCWGNGKQNGNYYRILGLYWEHGPSC